MPFFVVIVFNDLWPGEVFHCRGMAHQSRQLQLPIASTPDAHAPSTISAYYLESVGTQNTIHASHSCLRPALPLPVPHSIVVGHVLALIISPPPSPPIIITCSGDSTRASSGLPRRRPLCSVSSPKHVTESLHICAQTRLSISLRRGGRQATAGRPRPTSDNPAPTPRRSGPWVQLSVVRFLAEPFR